MKLLKWKDIRWDIVRAHWNRPWVLLGWPLISFYSPWGVSKNAPLLSKRTYESRPNTVIRLPWVGKHCTRKDLRASYSIIWLGWLFFWRTDLYDD